MNLAVIKVPCAPSAGLHPRRGRAAAAKTKSRCPWILPVGRHFVFSALPVKEHLDTLFERGSGISIRPMAGPERRKAIDPWAFPASHPVTLSDPLTHSSPGSAGPSYLMMADAAPCCTGTLLGVKSSSMYSPIHHFLVPAVLLRLGHHSPAWTDPGSLRENASWLKRIWHTLFFFSPEILTWPGITGLVTTISSVVIPIHHPHPTVRAKVRVIVRVTW